MYSPIKLSGPLHGSAVAHPLPHIELDRTAPSPIWNEREMDTRIHMPRFAARTCVTTLPCCSACYQALLSFIENGLHVTLVPRTLGGFRDPGALVSVC